VIPAEIYPCNIYILEGFTWESAQEQLENIYVDYKLHMTGKEFTNPGYTIRFPDGSIIVLIREFDVNTIAHEAFHVVEALMEYIGCKLTNSSSEPWAYLLGYIVEKIME
jgi:hypothetical protein